FEALCRTREDHRERRPRERRADPRIDVLGGVPLLVLGDQRERRRAPVHLASEAPGDGPRRGRRSDDAVLGLAKGGRGDATEHAGRRDRRRAQGQERPRLGLHPMVRTTRAGVAVLAWLVAAPAARGATPQELLDTTRAAVTSGERAPGA